MRLPKRIDRERVVVDDATNLVVVLRVARRSESTCRR
jgi:hypothetical protein